MYQYYNDERKNEVINIYKGIVKKEDIPAATQLFTTDWVVRYLVDNSLGRYWLERNPQSKLREKLDFFVAPRCGGIASINEKIEPEDLSFFDPCMGSGHVLVYAFDVLMEIYRECGYSDADAAVSVLNNNLYGVDIDDRAYQIAYFAVMMRGRRYDRRFFSKPIAPHIHPILESYECNTQNEDLQYLMNEFRQAKNYGSIVSFDRNLDLDALLADVNGIEGQLKMGMVDIYNATAVIRIAKVLTKQYCTVCTNPPYLNKMNDVLKNYVNKHYKDYSGDLFSVFIYHNFKFCKPDGYSAFMSPFVWMFIKTYEKLREYIIGSMSITTLIQMEYSAFEEATVPICAFVLKNGKESTNGLYFKLSDFKGGMEVQKQKVVEAIEHKDCGCFYETSAENFSKIPGFPIAYWVSGKVISAYAKGSVLGTIAYPKTGMTTGNNDKFLRLWSEVEFTKCYFNATSSFEAKESFAKWFPYCKGGGFKRWYGYNEYLVNWENDGQKIKNNVKDNGLKAASVRSESLYFKSLITWSAVTSGKFSCRCVSNGFLFDSGGSSITVSQNKLYLLAFLNGVLGQYYLNISNATINYQPGDIAGLPVIIQNKEQVESLAEQNIAISRTDWDSFETSWDFKKHPLLEYPEVYDADTQESKGRIELFFDFWKNYCEQQFNQLKSNEEELNRMFIDIYGLQDELSPEVQDKDITLKTNTAYRYKQKKKKAQENEFEQEEEIVEAKEIRNVKFLHDMICEFVSYAVGCMFGRYSLDIDGLAYAGGNWDAAKYSTFIPDHDNVLPITDDAYFADDIVTRFEEFVKTVYGKDMLEENLNFIAKALGNKSDSARQVIRNYFLKDFYKDHCKVYQKRPVYWLFDSGKADGFKALVYLHRYDCDTVGRVRADYLHKQQGFLENAIEHYQYILSSSQNTRDKADSTKKKGKLVKQLAETKLYDQALGHIALQRIPLDLDDGVKINYEKFQGVEVAREGQKTLSIDLLGKI